MTYPPQQPGQGGWGPPGQGWGQPAYRPQPGGAFPPSGPQQQPQQQPWQPGAAFAPGGPQPGFAAPPGYAPPPGGALAPGAGPGGLPGPGQPWGAPPKRKSPLPWILAGAGGLVLIGIVAVAFVVLTSGPGDPRPTAQAFVDRVNHKDWPGLRSLVCSKDQNDPGKTDLTNSMKQSMEQDGLSDDQVQQLLNSIQFHFKVADVQTTGSTTGTAHITGNVTISFLGQTKTEAVPPDDNDLALVVENGAWKACP